MTDDTLRRATFEALYPGEDWDAYLRVNNPGVQSAVNHAVKIADSLASNWLAEHDRQVAEKAWDEGYRKGEADVDEGFAFNEAGELVPQGSPHRKQEPNGVETRPSGLTYAEVEHNKQVRSGTISSHSIRQGLGATRDHLQLTCSADNARLISARREMRVGRE